MSGMVTAELSQIPMSQALAASLGRALEGARATASAEVTLEHLLAALCDDPDAADVLAASNINASSLRGETIAYLARSAGAGAPAPGEISVSAPVKRILEAAAAAARGGRRRDINGAIVLAAIVGDGRSVAAQILQGRGMTFDGAIRALQQALAQPPRQNVYPVAPAEDVLARARERVQSRSAPSLRDIMRDLPRSATPPPVRPHAPSDIVPAPPMPEPISASPPAPPAAPFPAREPDEPPSMAEATAPPASEVDVPVQTPEEPAALPSMRERPAHEAKAPATAEAVGGAPTSLDDIKARWPSEKHPPPGIGANLPIEQVEAAPTGDDGKAAGDVVGPVAPTPVSTGPFAPTPASAQPMNGAREAASAPSIATTARPAPPPPPAVSPAPVVAPRMAPPPIPPPIPRGPMTRAPGAMPMGGGVLANRMGPPPPGMPPIPHQGLPPQQPMQRVPAPMQPMPAPGTAPPINAPPRQAMPMPQVKPGQGAPTMTRQREARSPADVGELAENIPRSMRIGRTERVEVRIARGRVRALTEGMEGGGLAWRHDVIVTKAMSVRLRAPEGGFFIETASPETQWIDSQFADVGDEFASWRFLVTPNARGWTRLQIIVSARTVGADGLAAETAFPDQVIEVKVKANLKRALARVGGWALAAAAGGAFARFDEGAFEAGSAIVGRFMG